MSLPDWLRRISVSRAQMRAEIWDLGARHSGEPLEGALRELETADLSPDRTRLLRACVRELRKRKP